MLLQHAWPEWTALMEVLLSKGYISSTATQRNLSKEFNQIRTACLNFAHDRPGLFRYLSRGDIRVLAGSGCPSLDRKVVNSGKRLRASMGISEGEACRLCNFRGTCERAYSDAHKDEKGRTVDLMRFLVTYGFDLVTESPENQQSLSNSSKESVRNLLNDVVKLSAEEDRFKAPHNVGRTSMIGTPGSHEMQKNRTEFQLKQGDWICPKCDFSNFTKNVRCLRCGGICQERVTKLREYEHLPLKKGDWICQMCNFLNFAKNTKCLQCKEKPSNRQLSPGEWECPSCNYVNFRKNMICLKCDWRRPKSSSNNSAGTALMPGGENHSILRKPSMTFVRDGSVSLMKAFHEQKPFKRPKEDQIKVDECVSDEATSFDFPIAGGKSSISRDPFLRDKWRIEMSKRRSEVLEEENRKEQDSLFPSSIGGSEKGEYSSEDDELDEWFGYDSVQKQANMIEDQ